MRFRMTAGALAVLATALTAPASAATDPLAEFHEQQPNWYQCQDRPPPDPSEQPDDGIIIDPWQGQWKYLECAMVTVPLNYRDPDAGRLRIEISRHRATDPARRKGVLLLNPGGPGGGGLGMPLGARHQEIATHFDLIGFDPRGVGPSSEVECERVPDIRPNTTRPTDDQFPLYAAYARAKEDACERASGGVRPYLNTANTARDMDVIRAVLAEERVNYLGYSYGTYLGAVYGSLFPQRLNRSVLDSAVHPDWIWHEQARRQSVGVRFNVEQWAAWVAERDGTYHLGTSQHEVLATTEALAAALADRAVPLDRERPENWPAYWPTEVDRSTLDRFLATAAPTRPVWDVVAEVIGQLRAAAEGNTALAEDASRAVGMLSPIPKVDPGVYDTVTCEADWPADLDTYYEDMRHYRDRYPYADGNGAGVVGAAPTNCAFRLFTPPEPLVELARAGYPNGVVIQGDGDPATQYAGGPAMAAKLGHQLISVRDSGLHGHYGANPCVTEAVDDYLINGVLPPARSECADEPRPQVPPDDAPDAGAGVVRSADTLHARVEAASARQSIWR
ncbi:alpha/beta fold hydrolase [Actinophytocola sediminis]